MIRLTFVSTLAYNYFFPGKVKLAGGQTRIYNLAKEFAKFPEYEVICVTGDFGQPDHMIKDGVNLIKAPIDNTFAVTKVFRTIVSLKSDILLDFCASPRLFLYYLCKKATNVKYVFFTGSDTDVNGRYKVVENFIYDYFYRKGLKHADSIIAQVPYHKELLKNEWHMDSHLVLSPYLDIQQEKSTDVKDTILWVGRAAYYKQPELFIMLAQMFPEQKFVMICNESSYDYGFMKSIEKKRTAIKNLEFHEYVPYPEMAKFYKQAKVLVNTSEFEGFSNTFIEAAMHCTPVLSLNSDPNHMCSKHRCGYVCDGDFSKLTALCARIIHDDILGKKLGKNAFEYADKNHNLSRAAKQIDSIFKSLVI